MSKSVMLAMSGGTDSSVSAMLLQEQGYLVKGVTFRMYDTEDDVPEFVKDAKILALRLGIEHYTVDIRQHFRDDIIKVFTQQYKDGITPNPCVLCNNTIKWPYLVEAADKYGCEYIATGHYTKVSKVDGRFYIDSGFDPEKEQSFFLWGLDQSILSRTIFPLGEFTKDEIREMASQRGFEKVATKKDSMGVCFLQGQDYRHFIKKEYDNNKIDISKGNFVDEEGVVLGRHNGVPFYTLGQRRGLGINLNKALYVIGINGDKDEIILGDKSNLEVRRIVLENHLITDPDVMKYKELEVRIRYRKQYVLGHVARVDGDEMEIILHEPEILEAPGQTATLYHDGRILAGGWIKENYQE
ncbi:tRNA 2-thiouridine(34) synthase MnmA [Halosquirtibacter xylanolyticus]|uniref:tRNA 2-thiouridine(34) synthase MnmA n=1 Tax=Halosquirtibacter xylanolyticus TaxID=3374599 RepID=UPI003748FB39|nr:tRNA 2-thiouridine(34) synthase MnmA [Prolixibacteraceae bacterium]